VDDDYRAPPQHQRLTAAQPNPPPTAPANVPAGGPES